jgi:hypothetical protein
MDFCGNELYVFRCRIKSNQGPQIAQQCTNKQQNPHRYIKREDNRYRYTVMFVNLWPLMRTALLEGLSRPLMALWTIFLLFFFIIVSGVRLSPLGTAATTGLLYQPQMIDDGDCGEISGIKIGRGNRSTRRKPAPAPICPPQIPHDKTRARTRAAAVGSQRLTAWAMVRPHCELSLCYESALRSGDDITAYILYDSRKG